ncbi:MAG: hypothetical protein E7027_05260 [Elusimicrobium sp.]|uniref:AMP-activated protein kinase glycogen-binding domain-containing protein n=1 Tax=Candidatus Avelusimicrobium gallicola TaxID=2562704 RepID=A0A928DQ53_9BACT|nr:hypothetical protein [Elusimicrobium sp.]
MENENLEFDVKPAGNKDLWLFLIILDIILLCVFGFFLYKHFSTKIFNPSAIASVEEQTEVVEPLAIEDEAVLVTESAPIAVESVAATPKEEKATPKEEKLTEVVAAVTEQTEQVSAADKKESVLVKVNPKSKYRRVTFRWFGEGKKVSIVSGFTMAKPQALKKKDGYWETTLSIAPGTYKFLYVIDGVNTLDPYSDEKDGRSLLVLE